MKFKGHNIEFDFHILIKIKEAMVDVSSNCMELALKVRKQSQTSTITFYQITLGSFRMINIMSICINSMQERRNDAATRDSGSNISDGKRKEDAKLLWRDFQFAFRVYTLAGGHDDRADKLTRELAKEIESDPNQP